VIEKLAYSFKWQDSSKLRKIAQLYFPKVRVIVYVSSSISGPSHSNGPIGQLTD
jgi:hypothetical protein